MSRLCYHALVLSLVACGPADDDPVDDDAPVDSEPAGDDTDASSDTDAPSDTDPTDDTDPAGDTDPTNDTDGPADTDADTDPLADTDPGVLPPPSLTDCFGSIWGATPPVDYAPYAPVLGHHCKGTNHQDIQGVERVVFVGDSVTLGTPPTLVSRWWRNQVADALATQFGLTPPGTVWRNVDIISGNPLERLSGDFAVCAKYGARTDDLLLGPHHQLETCMPEDDRDLTTLVVMTIGGNDIFSILEDVKAGEDEATMRATYARATDLLRDAVTWVVEPGRFPNGVYVVFANTWDFTDPDSAEEMAACPGAQLIGLSDPLRDPILQDILADAQEEYLSIAVDTRTDLVFMGEAFCGHGNNADDPASRCYRGPGAEIWYDLTCEHPNGAGHAAIADLMLSVIAE